MEDDLDDICFECYEDMDSCTCGNCEGCGELEDRCICDLLEKL